MTSYQPIENHTSVKLFVTVVLAIWLALVFLLGAGEAFIRPPEVPPFPILLGATVPLLVFIAAYLKSDTFRAFILAADLSLLTAIQAWRAGGLGFLALYVHGILPGLFAWSAGLGDIAIGITAPWVALALIRPPQLCDQPSIRDLESLGNLGPRCCCELRRAVFRLRLRTCWDSDDSANGTAAAHAHTSVLCTVIYHAPSCGTFSVR